jgi:hypothetical protein
VRLLRSLVAAVAIAGAVVALQTAPRAQARPAPPGEDAIARAIEGVKADPNLATERTIRTLKWKTQRQRMEVPGWLQWLSGLIEWFNQSARVLAWLWVVVLVALLAVFVVRMVRGRTPQGAAARFIAPTHVRDLDIRPETLPADIGAAARQLWDRGEHRAALALLYRGLLSRLAHVHEVPIRDSSTEGDCLLLAAAHLPPARHEYVAQLIGVWQRAVYGHQRAQTAVVHALCDQFTTALDTAGTMA